MIKFIKTAYTKNMLYLEIDGKPTWTTTSEAVKEFAKKAIKEGEEVTIDSSTKNGQIFVNRISKIGTKTQPTKTETSNNKKSNHYSSPKKTYVEPRDRQESIELQNANNATAQTLIALQGQFSKEEVSDLIDELHAKYLSKIRGE